MLIFIIFNGRSEQIESKLKSARRVLDKADCSRYYHSRLRQPIFFKHKWERSQLNSEFIPELLLSEITEKKHCEPDWKHHVTEQDRKEQQ